MTDDKKPKAFPIFQVQLYRDEDGNCVEEWTGKKNVKRYHALIPGGLAEMQVDNIRDAFVAFREALGKAQSAIVCPTGIIGPPNGQA